MNNKKWVAYVGPFNFPWGQPGSRRVYGNAVTFMEAGYDVRVGCGDPVSDEVCLEQNASIGTSLYYQGLGELKPEASFINKLWTYLFGWGKETCKWLSSHTEKPSFVVLYGGMGAYAYHVLAWCKQNKVAAIVDVVEWYDPRQVMGGAFGPFYASSNLAMHYFYPRYDGVIAISSLLQQHFKSYGPVIRIPPTIAPASFREGDDIVNLGSDSALKLVYAGTPGKKDMLSMIIASTKLAKERGVNIQLLLIGPTVADIRQLGVTDEDGQTIVALGRIPQSEVLVNVHGADFSVLVREPLRFANAGFPTKFVESMATGTPVIANQTSDLGKYLVHGVTGFLVAEPTQEALYNVICQAARLSPSARRVMRQNALAMAKTSFDAKVYANELSQFLVDVDNGRLARGGQK